MAKIAERKKLPGGKVSGPDHTEGGVQVNKGEKPVAEIEGQERLFSKENTKEIEDKCQDILAARETGDEDQALALASELGFMVCEMVQLQDKNQAEQQPADYNEDEAINEFGNG
jgi:hypothetical protein